MLCSNTLMVLAALVGSVVSFGAGPPSCHVTPEPGHGPSEKTFEDFSGTVQLLHNGGNSYTVEITHNDDQALHGVLVRTLPGSGGEFAAPTDTVNFTQRSARGTKECVHHQTKTPKANLLKFDYTHPEGAENGPEIDVILVGKPRSNWYMTTITA